MMQSGFFSKSPSMKGIGAAPVLWLVVLVMGGVCLYQYFIDLQFAQYGVPAEAIVAAKHKDRRWYEKEISYYLTLHYASMDGTSHTEDYKTDPLYWDLVRPNDKINIYYLRDNPDSIQPREEHALKYDMMAFLVLAGACIFWMFIWP